MLNKFILALLITIVFTSICHAVNVTGKVHALIDNADDLWGKDTDYVLLEGVKSLASCKLSQGLVVIRIPETESQAFSMALAAQIAGKKITVDINDSRKDSGGYCIMRYLYIVND